MNAAKEDMSNIKTPWLPSYGDVPFHLDYPNGSMSDRVLEIADKYPKNIALSFMGRDTSYAKLADMIDVTAKAFLSIGIKPGEKIELNLLPDGRAELRAARPRGSFRELQGILKGKTNGARLSVEEINEAIAEAGARAGGE